MVLKVFTYCMMVQLAATNTNVVVSTREKSKLGLEWKRFHM